MSSMTATTGLPVERLKRSSSRKRTWEAVTVPPALLIRTTSARTSPSSAAFVSSSRTRTSSGTRGADGAPMTRLGVPPSSERNPEMSSRRILARPLPSTVCSRSGSIRGERATEMREQPVRSGTSAAPSHRRMGRVYNLAVVSAASTFAIDDVHAAAGRLLDRIYRTPVIASQPFDDASGYRVFFKCENLQRAGSFKIRGALNKLLALPAAERAGGVVAYSSGNHAQGVALAARITGTSAVICMPTDAPALKVEATRGYGAEIVFYDRMKDDRAALAQRIASETGRVLVPPYDDYAVMAGQGTAALELWEDAPALDALVTPVGGGGLMAGCATVGKSPAPTIAVIGGGAATANDPYLSLRKGARVTIPPPPTSAGGGPGANPGALTFPILRERLTDVTLVTDAEIVAAVRFLALRARIVVEPTGAVGAAAVLAGRRSEEHTSELQSQSNLVCRL